MRIGVNALYLIPGGVGGTEIYLRSLLQALARIDTSNEYIIFANRETGTSLEPGPANFHTHLTNVPGRVRPARILYEQFRLPRAVRGCDVLWNPGFTAPHASPVPCVTVFHDLQHKNLPHYFRWFELPFWKFFLWGSARTAHDLVAVSEFTANDLLRFYHLPRARVHTVPHGFDEEFSKIAERRRSRPPERYILCVSTLHPHKNLELLVEVFAGFHARHPDFRLVLAGMRGYSTAQVESAVAAHGLHDAVTITGWIDRRELLGLFERAWAFVYPSKFEGFGMPVLEALAAGLPVAASSIPPIRDVAGDAALLIDPEAGAAWAEALERICFDEKLRTRLIPAGPGRAAHFSWTRAAEQTLAILERAASPTR